MHSKGLRQIRNMRVKTFIPRQLKKKYLLTISTRTRRKFGEATKISTMGNIVLMKNRFLRAIKLHVQEMEG